METSKEWKGERNVAVEPPRGTIAEEVEASLKLEKEVRGSIPASESALC